MKYKYDILNKEEKRALKNEYKNSTEENKKMYKKINRIKILCIIGIIYAVIMMIVDFSLHLSLINKILDCLLLLFCLIFMVKINDITRMTLTKYLKSKKK